MTDNLKKIGVDLDAWGKEFEETEALRDEFQLCLQDHNWLRLQEILDTQWERIMGPNAKALKRKLQGLIKAAVGSGFE